LLRGLIPGPHGRAIWPVHTRQFSYWVSRAALKGRTEDCPIWRIPAGEIEAAVVNQIRALPR